MKKIRIHKDIMAMTLIFIIIIILVAYTVIKIMNNEPSSPTDVYNSIIGVTVPKDST